MEKGLLIYLGVGIVSQFTLFGDARKGKRPSYSHAAPPGRGENLYGKFIDYIIEKGYKPLLGRFGGFMEVSYTNMGPVTILLDSKKLF